MSEVKSKEKDYYVYTHSTEKHGIFYVGKGTGDRVKNIIRKSNPHHTNIVNKYGKENIIVRSMLCRNEQHALDLEVKLIAALRNGGIKLTNVTVGGDGKAGCTTSAETRAKMSIAAKGRVISDDARIKMSAAKIGKPRKPHSEQTKKKMSEVHKGKVITDESRAKMALAQKGKTLSDETKAKISASMTGKIRKKPIRKPHSAETKAKMAEAAKGRIVSDETRAKLVLAWEKRKLNKINTTVLD